MGANIILASVIFLTLTAIYFLPTIIAHIGNKKNRTAILLFNLFLGWTGIGWILGIVWANMVD